MRRGTSDAAGALLVLSVRAAARAIRAFLGACPDGGLEVACANLDAAADMYEKALRADVERRVWR